MINVSENLSTELPFYDTIRLSVEWNEALAVFKEVDALDVPCCMSLGTRRRLFQMIRAMGAKQVLDIGTYIGFSALTFALAVGADGHVVTVDIQNANAASQPDGPEAYWYTTGRAISPRMMMEIAGVGDRVDFITQSSLDYLRTTNQMFDFVCIDGHHEAPVVYEELQLIMPRLRPGALIFMDDVQIGDDPGRPESLDYIPGPWTALKQHLEEGAPLRVVHHEQAYGSWAATAFLLRKQPCL